MTRKTISKCSSSFLPLGRVLGQTPRRGSQGVSLPPIANPGSLTAGLSDTVQLYSWSNIAF